LLISCKPRSTAICSSLYTAYIQRRSEIVSTNSVFLWGVANAVHAIALKIPTIMHRASSAIKMRRKSIVCFYWKVQSNH